MGHGGRARRRRSGGAHGTDSDAQAGETQIDVARKIERNESACDARKIERNESAYNAREIERRRGLAEQARGEEVGCEAFDGFSETAQHG